MRYPRAVEVIAPVIEEMESRYPETTIARACVDALQGAGLVIQPSDVIAAARELAATAATFMKRMDELENPRPAAAWYDLRDALDLFNEETQRSGPASGT
jgi:hypothetical protein